MYNLQLSVIASQLEGLEETILYHLIERVQFKVNKVIYLPGKSGFSGESNKSLLDIRLRHQEEMDSRFGRYCVPEERPFSKDLPRPRRKVNLPEYNLVIDGFNKINLTESIKFSYIKLVPLICQPGDDGQYGSSVENDVYALQAISRRIHYGALFVAESKYRSNREALDKYIKQQDWQGLEQKLTRKNVENRIIKRVKQKVAYAQKRINKKVRSTIEPELILKFYRDTIIPLTKQGEILYLKHRKREINTPSLK